MVLCSSVDNGVCGWLSRVLSLSPLPSLLSFLYPTILLCAWLCVDGRWLREAVLSCVLQSRCVCIRIACVCRYCGVSCCVCGLCLEGWCMKAGYLCVCYWAGLCRWVRLHVSQMGLVNGSIVVACCAGMGCVILFVTRIDETELGFGF